MGRFSINFADSLVFRLTFGRLKLLLVVLLVMALVITSEGKNMKLMKRASSGYAMESSRKTGLQSAQTVMLVDSDLVTLIFQGFDYADGIEYARFRNERNNKYYWQIAHNLADDTIGVFGESDVEPSSSWDGRISCQKSQLWSNPLDWQRQGLQQTASGYGRKLTTELMIFFEGKFRRIYCTICSNSGTCWFQIGDREIIVDA